MTTDHDHNCAELTNQEMRVHDNIFKDPLEAVPVFTDGHSYKTDIGTLVTSSAVVAVQ